MRCPDPRHLALCPESERFMFLIRSLFSGSDSRLTAGAPRIHARPQGRIMNFDMKKWLDTHVVPLTQQHAPSHIHSFVWNGAPPKEILVWLLAGKPTEASGIEEEVPFNPDDWPTLVHGLIEKDGFRFDHLREATRVPVMGQLVPIFGSDGAPLLSRDGMASVRLAKRQDDGINLILQVGSHYPGDPEHDIEPAAAAAQGIKALFAKFDGVEPLEVCRKFGAVFGAA